MSYTTLPLPEPVPVNVPGHKPVMLTCVLLRDGRPICAHDNERSAIAHAMHLNKIERGMRNG